MRLKAVEIEPKGNLVVIGGRNGQGKTSLINAIASLFGGAGELPELPIRQGEESARVIAELDDCTITETVSGAGRKIVIKNKKGWAVSSPQTMLDKLTGKKMFDPLSFVRAKPDEQAATLRNLTGLDFTGIDKEVKRIYDERTAQNREVARLKAVASSIPEVEAPNEEVTSASIVAEITAANAKNNERATRVASCETLREGIDESRQQISTIQSRIAQMEQALTERQTELDTQGPSIDVAPITARLSEIEKANANVRKRKERLRTTYAANSAQEKSDEMSKKLEVLYATKASAIARTKFPVEGLSFNGDTVQFEGLPFSQTNSAKQIRVSVAIAAALNPELRMMIVRDGEKLDDEGLQLLAQLADEFNVQIFLERVGHGEECQIVIEDGSVIEHGVKS